VAGRAKTPEERAAKLAAAKASGKSAPAFQKGNQMALVHGAFSPGIVQPLVDQRLEAWLGDPDFPEYAKKPSQRFTLRSLARVEVRLELIYEAIEEMNLEDSLSEVSQTREKVTGGPDATVQRRRSRTEKRADYDERARRWETYRLNLLKELGLTPMAQTKMGRDVAAATVDLAQLIQQQQAAAEDGDGDVVDEPSDN
jgi:hypothetical protein